MYFPFLGKKTLFFVTQRAYTLYVPIYLSMHLSCIKYIYVSIFLIITGLKISDNTYASLLSTNNEYQYIKVNIVIKVK